MISRVSLLILLTAFVGVAGAAGERWADRLNAAEGETLLWLEADLVAEGPPADGAMAAVEGAMDSPAGDVVEATADTPKPAPEGAAPPAAQPPAGDQALPPAEEEETSAAKDRFPALVLPFLTPQPQGGVILVHDRGGHPDWPGVIAPLRRGLPDHGWATLSIEYPGEVAGPERRLRQAVKRIEAALRFYNERQLFNVVLVGHGEGALAAVGYLADNPRPGISGFVAVGLAVPPEETGGLLLLEGVFVPMLELYGERDLREVVVGARERQQAVLRGGNTNFRQQRVPGADHFFSGMEPTLVELVRRWLKRYSSGMEIKLGSREGRAIRKSLGLVDPAAPSEGDGAAGMERRPSRGDVELDDAP